MNDTERVARQDLAAAYRIFDYLGWAELIFAHLSLKVPGTNNQFLINPYGLLYSEVSASNLIKVDIDGNVIGETPYRFNAAGFVTHAAFHRHRPDAHCVFHAHTTAGIAVASTHNGLSMSNIYAAQLRGNVAYHDFEGITLYPDEGVRLIDNAGTKKAVILRNHGLFAIGESVVDAFNIMWLLNRACEVQVAACAIGPLIDIPVEIQDKCAQDSFHFNPSHGAGRDVFDALVRQIKRADPTYRA